MLAQVDFSYRDYFGINFTLIDENLYSGEGVILNGFVKSTATDIIIRFKWILIVDDVVRYISGESFITVT